MRRSAFLPLEPGLLPTRHAFAAQLMAREWPAMHVANAFAPSELSLILQINAERHCKVPAGSISFCDNSCETRRGENYMTTTFRILLIAVLATLATQASAQSRHKSRYEMVTIPRNQTNSMITSIPQDQNHDQDNRTDKIIILDKQRGELWSWSEPTTFVYLGKIFPIGDTGTSPRIIHVNPETKTR